MTTLIISGFFSSLAVISFFYLLGFSCSSNKADITWDNTFLWGGACFTLISWFGIKFGLNFNQISAGLIILTLCLNIYRYFKLTAVYVKKIPPILFPLLLYTFFYILISFILPLPGPDKLPIFTQGNNDIFNYLNNARTLFTPLQSNIAGMPSFILGGAYYETPLPFYLIDILHIFQQKDLLCALMPTLYMVFALIGCFMTNFLRKLFSLKQPIAILISAVILSSAFYRYLGAQYFLSTLTSTVIIFAFFSKPTFFNFSQWRNYLPAYICLFLTYSVLFFGTIFVHAFVLMFAPTQKTKGLLKLLSTILLVFLIDPIHSIKIFHLFSAYSNSASGWTLAWISPFAFLGLQTHIHVTNQILIIGYLSLFSILMIFMLYFYARHSCAPLRHSRAPLRHSRAGGNPFFSEKLIFLLIFLGGVFVYNLCYYIHPASYQAWKFASYFALPFGGVCWASAIFFTHSKKIKALIIAILFFCLCQNVLYARHHLNYLVTFSKEYQSLQILNKIPGKNLWIHMNSHESTFLATYFISNKKLYLLSPSYYPSQTLDNKKISSNWPLFTERSKQFCKKAANPISVGCLFYKIY